MKSCLDCSYAEWDRTKAGKLHPSGDGKCTWEYKEPKIPASFYWVSRYSPVGGYINRRKTLKKHCAFYRAKKN